MPGTVIIFLLVLVVSYAAFLLLFPRNKEETEHTKHALRQIMEATHSLEKQYRQEASIMRAESFDSPVMKAISALPFGPEFCRLILKAGMERQAAVIVFAMVVLFALLAFAADTMQLGLPGIALAAAMAILLVRYILKSTIRRRNDKFINMFPDVLDMIVRSVRSGFPLNTAMKMVAENMTPPVSTEFQQVRDELALGRSLDQALARLAQRVDEPDVNFFVVVLSVQHETGGNLAEVISNLSNIIRKRKQLRMKIKAMTSEGRATSYILGGLPILVFGALYFLSPDYLTPLFETAKGHQLLAIAGGLIAMCFWVVQQMVDIDI